MTWVDPMIGRSVTDDLESHLQWVMMKGYKKKIVLLSLVNEVVGFQLVN